MNPNPLNYRIPPRDGERVSWGKVAGTAVLVILQLTAWVVGIAIMKSGAGSEGNFVVLSGPVFVVLAMVLGAMGFRPQANESAFRRSFWRAVNFAPAWLGIAGIVAACLHFTGPK